MMSYRPEWWVSVPCFFKHFQIISSFVGILKSCWFCVVEGDLSLSLSLSLSLPLSLCLPACLSVSLSLSVCLSACLSFSDHEARVIAGLKELVSTVLHINFGCSSDGTVLSEQKSLMVSAIRLVFCCKPSTIKRRAVRGICDSDVWVRASKGICQGRREDDSAEFGSKDIALLYSFWSREWLGSRPSHCLWPACPRVAVVQWRSVF